MRSSTARVFIHFAIPAAVLLGARAGGAQSYWPEGARPGGLGGAYAAVSDDADGIFYNPAGLIYSPQVVQFSFGVQNLFSSGLPLQSSLSNAGAIVASHAGFVYNRLTRPNQTSPVLVLSTVAANGDWPGSGSPAPTSNIFSAGVMAGFLRNGLVDQFTLAAFFSKGFFEKPEAKTAANHLPHWLSASFTAKLVGLQYDAEMVEKAEVNSQEELFIIRDFFAERGRSQISAGLDFGMMAAVHPRVQLAFAWVNLLRPNLALAETAWAPRRQRLGACFLLQQERHWLAAVDAEYHEALRHWRFYLGTEAGVLAHAPQALRLRMGLNHNWISAGFRIARSGWLELDYAFLFPAFFQSDQPEGFFNHRFSLSFSKPPGAVRSQDFPENPARR